MRLVGVVVGLGLLLLPYPTPTPSTDATTRALCVYMLHLGPLDRDWRLMCGKLGVYGT